MNIEVGTIGLVVAIKLYGHDCVISYGDSFRQAIINIPPEDVVCFRQLVHGELDRLNT